MLIGLYMKFVITKINQLCLCLFLKQIDDQTFYHIGNFNGFTLVFLKKGKTSKYTIENL
jgi:hypothetical protein